MPGKSSFSFAAQRASQFDTTNILAATTAGRLAEPIQRPNVRLNLNGSFTTALSSDHTFRAVFQRNATTTDNLGVGGFNLPDRGYSSDATENLLRLSESGPLGRRSYLESRLQLRWADAALHSLVEAPSIVVLDAFTSGGAQQAGDRRGIEFEAATDLDYVRGRHSLRTGTLLEGGRYHSDQTSNYLGTFTFSTLDAYRGIGSRPSSTPSRPGTLACP